MLRVVVLAFCSLPAVTFAQRVFDVREPPALTVPTLGLVDPPFGMATVANPAALALQSASEIGLALRGQSEADPRVVPGVGLGATGLGPFSSLQFGVGAQWLRPDRDTLTIDRGTPWRLSSAAGVRLSRGAAFGVTWHHYSDREGAALRGLDSYDVGLVLRPRNWLGLGVVVRDLFEPRASPRRYEAEVALRPLAHDGLEVAAGGRVDEQRLNARNGRGLDGWVRAQLTLVPGFAVRGEFSGDSLVETTPSAQLDVRDWRIAVGLSFDWGGVRAMGLGGIGSVAESRSGVVVASFTAPARSNGLAPPSHRIEKLEITGDIGTTELIRWIIRLRDLQADRNVVAVVVEIDEFSAGWATTRELRTELAKLRARGIPVIAYLTSGATQQYFLASVADKIYMDPAGVLRLTGLSSHIMYYRDFLARLGIRAIFERIGEFKSAPEIWTQSGASEASQQQKRRLFQRLYDQVLADIAAGRKVSRDAVQIAIDGGPYHARELVGRVGVVDAVVESTGLAEVLAEELGGVYPVTSVRYRQERWRPARVAIVRAEGEIVSGKSQALPFLGRSSLGAETLIEAIAQARSDPGIAAIVLRIDSPGGSALASEQIAREVFRTRGTKPIVCSLGDTAASGGYFVAAGCDEVFAEAMTITGSIGIFAGKFEVSSLLERLAIGVETEQQGQHAGMDSIFRGFTAHEQQRLAQQIRHGYDRFVSMVARGRSMTNQAVDAVGRGRVWTGSEARAKGLVDRVGGLSEALDRALDLAGLSADEVEYEVALEPGTPLWMRVLNVGGDQGHARVPELSLLQEAVRPALRALPLAFLSARDQLLALMPFAFDVVDAP